MLTFLQIVGGFFVAIILLILVIYLFIRWKLRKFFKGLAEFGLAVRTISGTTRPSARCMTASGLRNGAMKRRAE